jgi:hypothetical protein
MNIIQLQDNLKNLSDQQLTQAMQMPSQDTPPFLVVSELNRRKKMRDSFQAQQADQNKTTVAQDVVAAAGVPQGPASQMAQSLAPKTDMTNNTGIMSIPQGGKPQRMAGGGVVKMNEGMTVPAMTYADFLAAIQAGNRPTEEQYMASVDNLNDQQAADIRSMLDDPTYVPQDWEQNAANAPGVTPTTPAPPMPSAAWDWAAGVFGGRTLGEQQAIDAQRVAAADTKGPPKTGMTYGIPEALGRIAPVSGATPDAPKPPTTSGGGGGGGGGGGSSKPSDYEQALMDALANADKKAKQDKWMALAQMGLSLMSSQQPNFFAAVGEAGTNAIPTYQKARDTADDTKLGLNKGLYDIAMQRQARNDAMAAAAASAAAKSSGGFGISTEGMRVLTAAKDAVALAANRLTTLGIQPGQDPNDPNLPPEQRMAIKAALDDYDAKYNTYSTLSQMATMGIANVGGTAEEDPTATKDVAD